MKKFISVIALLLASFTSMAASVSFPESLDIIGVNGLNNVDSRYLELENGQNLIELQYRDLFESNADDSNWVRSEPLYLYIDLKTAAHYNAITPSILSEEDAYRFINSPYLKLTDASGSEKQVALMTHSQLMTKLLFNK